MLALAIKSSAVLGLAWMVTALLQKRSAAARHLVWIAAAGAVLILPLLSMVMPVLSVPAETRLATVAFHATAVAARDVVRSSEPIHRGSGAVQTYRTIPNWPGLVWLAGTLVLLVRMLLGYAAMWRMRRAARVFDGASGSPVKVIETTASAMPMTFGILRPVILVPAGARQWNEERLRVVLSHELAHVRRGDAASHMLVWAAVALYWWNPLVWLAWRRVRRESECAADDLVLNDGVQPSQYAGHLLEIARSMGAPWTAVAMARGSQLEGRLRAILDSSVNRASPGRAVMLTAAMLAVAVVAPLAALKAQDAGTIPDDVDAAIRSALSQKNHEILEDAARAAVEMRKYDTAQKLLEAAAEIRGEVSGRESFEYGIGLLKLGDLEQKRHDWKAGDEFYGRAAAVLGDRLEAAHALMALGVNAIVRKDLAQASDYLEKAQRADPKSGTALMWMAVVWDRQGNASEADALFRRAVGVEEPKSAEGVIIARTYAHFLRKQGRKEEAQELETRANAAQNALKADGGARKPAAGGGVYRIGGGVSAPKVLSKVEPEYSEEARAAQLEGTVTLTVEIGPDGVARNFGVTRGLGLGLEESAMDAISQWRFQPGAREGQPVTVLATIEVSFHLL